MLHLHQPLSVCVFLPLTNFRRRHGAVQGLGHVTVAPATAMLRIISNLDAETEEHQGEEVIHLGTGLHGTSPLMLSPL